MLQTISMVHSQFCQIAWPRANDELKRGYGDDAYEYDDSDDDNYDFDYVDDDGTIGGQVQQVVNSKSTPSALPVKSEFSSEFNSLLSSMLF